jgi:hypothetical protein
VRRHGGQAQGGAQTDAVKGHLIDAVFHRAKVSFWRISGAFTLFASFSTTTFGRLSSATRSAGITAQ